MRHGTTFGSAGTRLAEALSLPVGLLTGTSVLTMRGGVAVEALALGDRVVTRAGAASVRALRSRPIRVAVVRIRAGSLGHEAGERDVLLGPGTRVRLRDWRAGAIGGGAAALVEAHRLVDGEFVTEERPRALMLHVLSLGAPQVVYADGLEVEV